MTSSGLSVVLHSGGAHNYDVTQQKTWRSSESDTKTLTTLEKNEMCLEQFYMGFQCHHLPPYTYICSAFPLTKIYVKSLLAIIGLPRTLIGNCNNR